MSVAVSSSVTQRPDPGSFVRRKIDVTFKRGAGKFTSSNSDTVTLSGLRVSAHISQAGGMAQGTLDMQVFGMTISQMNDLAWAGNLLAVPGQQSVVTVQAGTSESGMSVIYSGPIAMAMTDYTGAPHVSFYVTSLAAQGLALAATPPNSYKGGADAAVVMSDLARLQNMPFENNGVSGVIIHNPYFHGSPLDQMQQCADTGGFEMAVVNRTLAIWPKGGARGKLIPLVSPQTGLVGYPVRTPIGVTFTTLFNPSINPHSRVELKTSVIQCSGQWNITGMDYVLESEVPHGAWFSYITCLQSPDGSPAPASVPVTAETVTSHGA